MAWYYWVIIVLAIMIMAILVLIGYIAARSLYHPHTLSFEESYLKEEKRSPGIMKIHDSWPITKYRIESRYGYPLQIYYVPALIPSKKFVVIAHGYTYTYHGSVKYADLMRELNYNVIMYDERFHGASGGGNCSMGYYEKDDLFDIITDTFARYGDDIELGTYGESMGGATVMLEQATDQRIRFAISDCAYAELSVLLTYLIRHKTGFPKYPVIWTADLFFRLATKADIFRISPRKAVMKAKTPMLFMHGEEDDFIPPVHSRMLFEACSAPKMLYIGGNHAKHTDASRYNREEYLMTLKKFLHDLAKMPD